jgi:type IV pilus assembly protein PilO
MRKALALQILRENRILVTVLLLALFVCCSLWYAAFRQGNHLAQLQSDWNNKRRLTAPRAEAQRADSYQRDREQIRELYATIPYRHEFPRVISEIMDFMALRGATPGGMSYKVRKTDLNGLLAYSMTCSASGSYPGLKRLIGDLERLDGISTLDSVSFSSPDSGLEKVALDLQLTIYLREKQP